LPSVSSLDEAAAVFRQAAATGGGVSIDRPGGDVVLSTDGLDRILEHEAGDLTATVEAGIRLSALNARLAEHGQMLALDPPGDPTVGACLAGNLSGPRRFRYGEPRDLVLGVTLVLADGTIAHSGGKVVKNVAGYDLGKLFCGSRGQLGLIARASLRLHPRPAVSRTLLFPVGDLEEAAGVALLVERSPLEASAFELLPSGAIALLFEGSERAVEAQLARALELFGGEEADESVFVEAEPLRKTAPAPEALLARLRREFDPQGVLA
jgi:glycolate oxidase FAD binding subunit